MSEPQIAEKKAHPFSKEARAMREKKENKDVGVELNDESFESLYGLPDVDPDKQYVFEQILKKNHPNQGIPNRCEIYDKIEKKLRVIRYAPHEASIFQDEQTEIPSGGYFVDTITFPYGECRVDGKNRNLVLFLLLHNDNVISSELPSRNKKFKLLDKEGDAKLALAIIEVKQKAQKLASECEFDDMISFAKILGIDVKYSKEREQEIRHQFIIKSVENPSLFLKGFNDPKNKRLYVILKAFEQGIITDTHIKNEIHWLGSKVQVCNVPPTVKSAEYLTDYSFSNEGEEFYKLLLKQVD